MKRICLICSQLFEPSGRKLFCSEKCRKERQKQQLQQLAQRKKEARPRLAARPCNICKQPFTPKHSKQVYCDMVCAKEGLKQAIERQRQRREQSKAPPPAA